PLSSWTLALNFWLNERLGLPGAAPFGFHVVNIALHGMTCVAAFVFLNALTLPRWVSATSAAFFAVHPIHTEAVAAIIGRAEILAMGFGLTMLTLHRLRRSAAVSAIAYLLALLSKESALMFFPLAISMDALFARGQ
ncbi:MAG: hypothetical protein FJY97_19230, partial [candidate division Zixibacteria bacterium]|nr:hypothetical protein [candidate division Zixibacteria bacterium]